MRALGALPLLVFALLLYNAVVFLGSPTTLEYELMQVALLSGARWSVTVRDALIVTALFLLYVEIFKATRTSVSAVINHTLSTVVFIAFVVEFITVAAAGAGPGSSPPPRAATGAWG